MGLKEFFEGPIDSGKRLKRLIIFFAIAHVVFLVFGQWAVYKGIPAVLEMREAQLKAIRELLYLKPLTGVFAGSLTLKILYTFVFNLIFGAFLSTTIAGFVFFLPYLVAVWRSFIIGVLVWGLDTSATAIAVFYGTFIFEFGAYCLSSAVGTDLGLTLLHPRRHGKATRKEAVRAAFRSGMRLYVFVIILLLIGAAWEITWLHHIGPLIMSDPSAAAGGAAVAP